MEIDKLKDEVKYRLKVSMEFFADSGVVLTGKEIKEGCPFDISPHQGIDTFFEKV